MKKQLPNFLTICNLLIGSWGVINIVAGGNIEIGIAFVALSAVFDFLDGFAARLLKVSSPIGKQLDSLADLISFGLLPAVLVMKWLEQLGGDFLPLIGLTIVAFSAIRLAKFNIDERQSDRFIGLPTPANALFFTSLPFLEKELWNYFGINVITDISLSIITLVFSYLLISEIRLPALKFKNYNFRDNKLKYFIMLISVISLGVFQLAGFAFIILFYLLMSLFEKGKSTRTE